MPRRKPWNGNKPKNAEDARRYLIKITGEIVDEVGFERASLAEVAERAGVTRQTVYRYFENTTDLFRSAQMISANGLWTRMVKKALTIDGWPERLIEGVVFTVAEIPKDPQFSHLFQGDTAVPLETMLRTSFARDGAAMLADGPVPMSDEDLAQITELLIRLTASFLRAPAESAKGIDGLREMLQKWLIPAIRERMTDPPCEPTEGQEG